MRDAKQKNDFLDFKDKAEFVRDTCAQFYRPAGPMVFKSAKFAAVAKELASYVSVAGGFLSYGIGSSEIRPQ